MYKVETQICDMLDENTYVTKLDNGLNVYICKKKGFKKKIGMFGTKYGSVTNDFVDIKTNTRIKVPDGIAHFLEHKLFEKEEQNALDMFSNIGVSSNAYTSFDQTVYYFETSNKFKESIELLVKLIKEPYFTDENVAKEQGIIGQEIMMYDDDPSSVVYMNALKAMYQKNNVRTDIAGTIDSISHITKELLYTCYNTFYNPSNMFFIVVGDVDVDDTIKLIDKNIKKYETKNKPHLEEIKKFYEEEDKNICKKEIVEKMDIFMPLICIGYKLDIVKKEEIVKRALVADIVSDMYFSKITEFFKDEYDKGVLSDSLSFMYEGTDTFSHVIISTESTKINELQKDLFEYIDKIKNIDVDEELFGIVKNNKIGSLVSVSDNLNVSYRRIIDSILCGIDVYSDVNLIKSITKDDVKEFLNLLSEENRVVSIINPK